MLAPHLGDLGRQRLPPALSGIDIPFIREDPLEVLLVQFLSRGGPLNDHPWHGNRFQRFQWFMKVPPS